MDSMIPNKHFFANQEKLNFYLLIIRDHISVEGHSGPTALEVLFAV